MNETIQLKNAQIRIAFLEELKRARDDAAHRSQRALEIGVLADGANQSKSDTTKHQLGLEQDAAIETFRSIDFFLSNADKELPSPPNRENVAIGSAIVLDSTLQEARETYFIVPRFGGITFAVDGLAIQTLSIDSPLGSRIMGKQVGWTIINDLGDEQETTSLIEII